MWLAVLSSVRLAPYTLKHTCLQYMRLTKPISLADLALALAGSRFITVAHDKTILQNVLEHYRDVT